MRYPRFSIFLCVSFIVLFPKSALSSELQTLIEKSEFGTWEVLYSASQSVEKIAFRRNPDTSRTLRWLPEDKGFEVHAIDGKEFISRKDGETFSTVRLRLTPTYRHLPKDYAPFSPFSDGGMLIHSGRFFACVNHCDDATNQWRFKLSVPIDEHIIIDGELATTEVSWVDSDSGRSLYVGRQQPMQTHDFLAVIDRGLPQSIKTSLESDIPKMTAYFESRLGGIPQGIKPTLFASYANVDGMSVQGGVLPNQIFIHWDKNDLDLYAEDESFINELLWVFSHEVAHFYQRFESANIELGESWIHEGHAEFLAFDLIKNLYPDSVEFRSSKIAQFERMCAKHLETTSLEKAADDGQFQAYYSCGFLIYHVISKVYDSDDRRSESAYSLWRLFREKLEDESLGSKEAMFESISELTNKDLAESIISLINTRHVDANQAVRIFMQQAYYRAIKVER